jgi:uncharacterized protein (TIGR00255 family)
MLSNNHQIKSMTGSGQAHFVHEGLGFDLVAKSLNSRGLDIIIRLPKELLWLEADFYAVATKKIKRGRLEISIICELSKNLNGELAFNEDQAEKLLEQLFDFSKKFPIIKREITFGQLLSVGNLFEIVPANNLESLKIPACEALEKALFELIKARVFEGKQLALVLNNSLERCIDLIKNINIRADSDIKNRFSAISARVKELFSDMSIEINPDRLLQECALLAERADFKEEIDRLIAHCEHFVKLCDDKEPKGRRLDFLCQEMLRESSTLLTKAFEHAVIALAIELKAEIERLREQVQNIE